MTPPIQYDTLEKRFRDLQLRYTRSRKHITCIGLVVVSLLIITLLGFLLKGRKHLAAIDFELFGPHKHRYVVDTPNCRIFNYEPFNDDVDLYRAQVNYSISDHPGTCGSLPLLSSVSRNATGHTLHLRKEYFAEYSTSAENTTCCYSYIFSSALLVGEEENSTVDEPKYMKCKEFNGDVKLETDFDFVRVTCGKKVAAGNLENPPSDVYKHFHSYVSMKREVRVKMDLYNETIRSGKKFENHSEVAPWEKPGSVIIIGLDSVSRLNLLRMMPKTVEYLENSGWYGLEGYTKVGDNTFPNLAAAVLAGAMEEKLRETCMPREDAPVDWCPWIWGKYSSQGYITAYGEDSTKSDTFYVRAGGFRHPPTDYFLRTLLKAADDYTQSYWFEKLIQQHDCVGNLHEFEYVFDFSLEFAEVLNFYPKFGLFWLNSFSHDRLYGPKPMDDYLRNYLQKLTNIVNDTIVVFMSDHGMAHGVYRQTEMGLFETNLPFIYFWLPESFQKLNPQAAANLELNKHRLTSHFDLHMTLLDLLGDLSSAPGCPKCKSLFQPVPLNRTCDDAGIPLRYCSCTQYTQESNTLHIYLAEFLMKEIMKNMESFQEYTFPEFRCANFSLKTINFIKRVVPNVDTQRKPPLPINENTAKAAAMETFVVSIETEPKALYEAMISEYENGTMRIIDTILRIDSYDQQSRCLNKEAGRPYCVCEARIGMTKMIMDDEKRLDAQLKLSSSVDPS